MTHSECSDPRHLQCGLPIPTEGYADQPYIVQTDDGAWLCTLTTGGGHEGQSGQHVISMRSEDQGATWSPPVDVEPGNGPESSYSVLLKTSYGRLYVFYNYNTDGLREVRAENGRTFKRVDSLGDYVFKYSDDHGRSWSAQRYNVPIRAFTCDRQNVYGGAVRFFWNVGKPIVLRDGAMLMPHIKVGAFGEGFLAQSEGAFLRSDNIMTERDPEKVRFHTLPDGDTGLVAPAGGGRIAEEQSVVELSDGSLFCVYRTLDGWSACSYSRDGGRTWSRSQYLTYEPGGQRRFKHPRAANFVWKLSEGRYLYWFHNHCGAAVRGPRPVAPRGRDQIDLSGAGVARQEARLQPWDPYNDRNPVWLCAGVEVQTPTGLKLRWSQPQIVLYDDDPFFIRISYPDLVLSPDGQIFITETQKATGRVHAIDPALIDGLFSQFEENGSLQRKDLLLEQDAPMPAELPMPSLPPFHRRDGAALSRGYPGADQRNGVSIELELMLDRIEPGQVLLDSRMPDSEQGCVLRTETRGRLRIELHDGRQLCGWTSDVDSLAPGRRHGVTVIIDGGPKVILFVIDGQLQDGGNERQFGFGRFSPSLLSFNGHPQLRIANTAVQRLRIWGRALHVGEAVQTHRSWDVSEERQPQAIGNT